MNAVTAIPGAPEAVPLALLDGAALDVPPVAHTKRFSGSFLLFRKSGAALKRMGVKDQQQPPRFRHPTFDAAAAEARRLLLLYPESTFIIIQEVGRVKMKPADEIDG